MESKNEDSQSSTVQNLVGSILEQAGLLQEIRASLHAKVYNIVNEKEKIDSYNSVKSFIDNNKDASSALALVGEFLNSLGLKHTLSVFKNECAHNDVIDTKLNNDRLIDSLKLDPSKKEIPLLMQVLQLAQSNGNNNNSNSIGKVKSASPPSGIAFSNSSKKSKSRPSSPLGLSTENINIPTASADSTPSSIGGGPSPRHSGRVSPSNQNSGASTLASRKPGLKPLSIPAVSINSSPNNNNNIIDLESSIGSQLSVQSSPLTSPKNQTSPSNRSVSASIDRSLDSFKDTPLPIPSSAAKHGTLAPLSGSGGSRMALGPGALEPLSKVASASLSPNASSIGDSNRSSPTASGPEEDSDSSPKNLPRDPRDPRNRQVEVRSQITDDNNANLNPNSLSSTNNTSANRATVSRMTGSMVSRSRNTISSSSNNSVDIRDDEADFVDNEPTMNTTTINTNTFGNNNNISNNRTSPSVPGRRSSNTDVSPSTRRVEFPLQTLDDSVDMSHDKDELAQSRQSHKSNQEEDDGYDDDFENEAEVEALSIVESIDDEISVGAVSSEYSPSAALTMENRTSLPMAVDTRSPSALVSNQGNRATSGWDDNSLRGTLNNKRNINNSVEGSPLSRDRHSDRDDMEQSLDMSAGESEESGSLPDATVRSSSSPDSNSNSRTRGNLFTRRQPLSPTGAGSGSSASGTGTGTGGDMNSPGGNRLSQESLQQPQDLSISAGDFSIQEDDSVSYGMSSFDMSPSKSP